MIRFTNHPESNSLVFDSKKDLEIDASHLTVLPALIDPHVHFRTPGHTHKEDWIHAARAAIAGGVTCVFDMPNNNPSCVTKGLLNEKRAIIEEQLKEAKIPLRYHLYFGAHADHLDEIAKVKKDIIGIKLYLGCTTGSLIVADPAVIEEVFAVAKENNLMVSVHSENQSVLLRAAGEILNPNVSDHSNIRPREAAIVETRRVIEHAKKFNVVSNILHLSTKEEVQMIREAKKEGIPVHAETTPNHLFFNTNDYPKYGTLVQMNPPIREKQDQEALFEGINDGTIDWIGTDHAPHTLEEKKKPYPLSPSGIPGIETLLPLLLNAVHEGRFSLKKLIELTNKNITRIFKIPKNNDKVLVDLKLSKEVNNSFLKTKCGFSPYHGWQLQGWPIYTILKNHVFDCQNLKDYTV